MPPQDTTGPIPAWQFIPMFVDEGDTEAEEAGGFPC